MHRLRFASFVALWFIATGVSPAVAAETAKAARPNIIVIIGDDMGYADIGPHGCKDIPTPGFDALAKNGVRCTSGYVSGPYCSPTRAGLLTGRYQQRFGHEFNPGPEPNDEIGLPLSETTLPDRLKAAGYRTGMVGKWHLGTAKQFQPPSRGFEEFFGFLGGSRSYFPLPNANNVGAAMRRGYDPIEEKDPYTTDAFTREATAFIEKHAKEPFFLYLAYNAVHGPMHATEKYLSRFPNVQDEGRRTYCAMMSAMDDGIGEVLKTLDENKLTENTLVFFVSDNGGPTGVNSSSNAPLRGDKAQTWEGGIRVPYLVQWKGTLPAGKTYDQPVIQLDICTTALAAAGAEPKDAKLDGVNLLPYLKGDKTDQPHDALYWRFGDQMAIRSGNYKLVQGRGAEKPMLFDLAADIGETKDLSAEKPEVAKELADKYAAWNSTLEKPRWGNPNRQLGGGKNKEKKKAKREAKKAKAAGTN